MMSVGRDLPPLNDLAASLIREFSWPGVTRFVNGASCFFVREGIKCFLLGPNLHCSVLHEEIQA